MEALSYESALREHVVAFFAGHQHELIPFRRGAVSDFLPEFCAVEVEPGPKTQLWVYVSVGIALIAEPPLEFLLVSAERSHRQVELLAMCAHYHRTRTLGLGHTLPIGEPWVPGSTLDQLLVSLPYPFGPELERFSWSSQCVHILWMLPITGEERAFKVERGLEALESKFDEAALEFWDAARCGCQPPTVRKRRMGVRRQITAVA